jgi:hypothetical protein
MSALLMFYTPFPFTHILAYDTDDILRPQFHLRSARHANYLQLLGVLVLNAPELATNAGSDSIQAK